MKKILFTMLVMTLVILGASFLPEKNEKAIATGSSCTTIGSAAVCCSDSDCGSGQFCNNPGSMFAQCQNPVTDCKTTGCGSGFHCDVTTTPSQCKSDAAVRCNSNADCSASGISVCQNPGTSTSACVPFTPPLPPPGIAPPSCQTTGTTCTGKETSGPCRPEVTVSQSSCDQKNSPLIQRGCTIGASYTDPVNNNVICQVSCPTLENTQFSVTSCVGNETSGPCRPERIDQCAADRSAQLAGPNCKAIKVGFPGIDKNTGLSYYYYTDCSGGNGGPVLTPDQQSTLDSIISAKPTIAQQNVLNQNYNNLFKDIYSSTVVSQQAEIVGQTRGYSVFCPRKYYASSTTNIDPLTGLPYKDTCTVNGKTGISASAMVNGNTTWWSQLDDYVKGKRATPPPDNTPDTFVLGSAPASCIPSTVDYQGKGTCQAYINNIPTRISYCLGTETTGPCALSRVDKASANAAAAKAGTNCVAQKTSLNVIDQNTGLDFYYKIVCSTDGSTPSSNDVPPITLSCWFDGTCGDPKKPINDKFTLDNGTQPVDTKTLLCSLNATCDVVGN